MSTGALIERREHGGTWGEGDDCDEGDVFAFVATFVALPRSHCFKAVDAGGLRRELGIVDVGALP